MIKSTGGLQKILKFSMNLPNVYLALFGRLDNDNKHPSTISEFIIQKVPVIVVIPDQYGYSLAVVSPNS